MDQLERLTICPEIKGGAKVRVARDKQVERLSQSVFIQASTHMQADDVVVHRVVGCEEQVIDHARLQRGKRIRVFNSRRQQRFIFPGEKAERFYGDSLNLRG